MQHFYRAYQLTDSAAVSLVGKGGAGAELPSSLSEMTLHFLGTKAIHASRQIRAHPWRDAVEYLAVPLNAGRREFTAFSSQVIYSPLDYLPQSLGIALGRLAGLGPLGLLLAARVANALVCLGIIVTAVMLFPSGRLVVATVTLLPMAIYEMASASADGLIIASAALYTALAIKGMRQGAWTAAEIALGLLAGLVVSNAKFPYLCLLCLALPCLLARPRRKSVLVFAGGIPVLCGLASVAWLNHAAPLVVIANSELQASNAHDQLAFLSAHPWHVPTIILQSARNWRFYRDSMIGDLGWLTVPMPSVAIWLGLSGLICAVLYRPSIQARGPRWLAAWTLTLAAGSIGLTAAALYLTWTPVGKNAVDGFQGRYLLPIVPMVLFGVSTIPGSRFLVRWAPLVETAAMLMVMLNAVLTVAVVVRRFHILG